MKKLMILAAVAVATATTFGATYNWQHKSGQYLYDGASTAAKLTSGTTYLFVSSASDLSEGYSAYTQQSLLNDVAAGKTTAEIATKAISTSSIGTTAGRMSNVNGLTYNGVATDGKLVVYTAIIDGDKVFISDDIEATAQASSTGLLQLADTTADSKNMYNTKTFSNSGWYNTVPEPTSGLLLLIGMAGLALRRRRA